MAELTPGQSAQQMIQRQLDELGSLFNAGVRSQSFREWRQNTLTCIQRIWPAEPARPERFRRIPFSPPMGRPGEREIRDYYERGCGEAASLLKDYIQEIATVGAPQPGAGASGAGAAPVPGRDDDYATLDLPGPSAAAGAGAVAPPSPPKPRLKDLLGFTDAAAPVAPPAPTQHPSAGAPPLPQAPAQPAASGAPPLPQAPAQPPAASGAPPLPHAPAPAPAATGAPPLPQAPAPAPAATGAPPLPHPPVAATAPQSPPAPPSASPASASRPADLETHGFFAPPGHTPRMPAAPAPPIAAPPPVASTPPVRSTPPATPPGHEPAARRSGADDLERVAEDLLRASSALSSLPRRATPEPIPVPRDVRSPIPLAIAGLALEVEALGVPEGHRARARAVLLDLSRRLEAPSLSWESLREAMNFVMEFPALGRRMIPLLLPYFDRAA